MKRFCLLSLIGFVASVSLQALSLDQFTIDFTNEIDASKKARWSDPDTLTVSSVGLGLDDDALSSHNGWFVTTPLAIGFWWRPATSATLRATIKPTPKNSRLSNDPTSISQVGQLYVRYGCDYKNWSSWQALQFDRQSIEGITYIGLIKVPRLARKDYDGLISEYTQLDVPWTSDQEAAVRWILSNNPTFFENSSPFIGYLQFLYEATFSGDERLLGFTAHVLYGVSTMHNRSKDKSVYKNKYAPWRFKAE